MTQHQLRILHVVSGDLWAGAEAQVCALLTALHRRDEVTVAAVVMNPGELANRLAAAGIEVFVKDESRQNALQLFFQLRHLMRAWRPDIVHTHRQKENVLGALAAWLSGIPSLRTAHGAAEHGVPFWHLHKLHKWLFAALDNWFAIRVQRCVVAVAEDLAERLRAALPGARIEMISNGIDVADVRALAATGLAARPLPPPWHVAIVGRLVPVKRVDLFIAMAAELEQQHPGAYRFHVIGDGPLRGALEAEAAQSGARDCIQFHGFQSDVLTLIARMHALVNTSDHEGLPMTALEALALDLRVIARAVGGLVPLLAGNPRAWLVDSNDQKILAATVVAALPVPGELPADTHHSVLLPAGYTLDASVNAYAALYVALNAGLAST